MTDPIDPIDEDERDNTRRITWADVYLHFNPTQNDVILRKDLLPCEIDRLDRTAIAAKASLSQMDIASPADQFRCNVSKTAPLGSAAVVSAAKSAAIATKPKIRSLFDLSSNLGNNSNQTIQHSLKSDRTTKDNQQKGFDAFRKEIKTALQHLDAETVNELNKVFTAAQDPSNASEALSANRPRLEPPRLPFQHTKNYMLMVIDLHDSMEKMISDCTDHLETQTKRDLQEMQQLREEKIKAIEEHVRAMDNQESWSTLANIARYFTFASTAILGATLLSTGVGGAAGYILIASGGLGLVNAVATDLEIWKGAVAYFTKSEEMQHRIAQQIDLALTLISLGLGLIGGNMAYQANAIELARQASRETVIGKAKEIIGWFSAIFLATAHCGKNWAERKDSLIRADMERIETKIFMIREQLKSKDIQTHQTVKMAQIIVEETTRILASSELSLAN